MKKSILIKYTFRSLLTLLILATLTFVVTLLINLYIIAQANPHIITSTDDKRIYDADVIIILGAQVHSNGTPSGILKDRLDTAYKVYEANPSLKVLLSGDHGTKYYDEVNTMKTYLINKGIPTQQLYLDHAGFSTYETMYRAKEIFEVKSAIIITQDYHLKRALYLAESMGIQADGVAADILSYPNINYFKAREYLARVKDFLYITFLHPEPTYLGEKIPIMSSDSTLTYDE